MEKHPRGLALILSNTEFENDTLPRRLGGEIDEINLKRLFDRLGFEVQSHPNKSKDVRNVKTLTTSKQSV